jgi:hypothetical protein
MTDFERLSEEIEKSHEGIGAIEFLPNEVLPNPVIRAFVKIEDAINETSEAIKAKKTTLSKASSMSLNKLK